MLRALEKYIHQPDTIPSLSDEESYIIHVSFDDMERVFKILKAYGYKWICGRNINLEKDYITVATSIHTIICYHDTMQFEYCGHDTCDNDCKNNHLCSIRKVIEI